MKKIVSLVLVLVASSPVCAMQTSKVFAQVLTEVVEKKTETPGSIQASSSQIAPEQALSTQTSCSQYPPKQPAFVGTNGELYLAQLKIGQTRLR